MGERERDDRWEIKGDRGVGETRSRRDATPRKTW